MRYKYRLEGFEEKENNVGSNKSYASYTNLPFGRYKFTVNSTNADGVPLSKSLNLYIRIRPPFYLTWYFISSVVLLMAAAVYGFIAFREKQLKADKQALQNKLEAGQKELDQQKKGS
ncbi:MAG: hypothetical protein HC896_15725 [Bacteroidales bacterium]|nr:hypothetical protein [Bacteroidales bacterium]